MKKIAFITICLTLMSLSIAAWQPLGANQPSLSQTGDGLTHHPEQALAPASVVQSAAGSCRLITFEGVGNNEEIPPIEGITTPLWLGLIDADDGGTGDFANEPSPSTVAYWFDEDESTEREILFDPPVSQVSLFYASFVETELNRL